MTDQAQRAPTGTVTFLFTDLEGSTSRWEQQTETMPTVLAHHDSILREAIAEHRGVIVKATGDGVHAAFRTAQDGVAAALAAQRALHATDWGEAGTVRVRMALHTGAAEERDGDYFGPSVNRAARLMSVAHGGQVLLSLATQELVRDLLPAGVELLDLREHRLKDLIRPEHIFQVVVTDLRSDFGPLRTLDARPHNLPVQRDLLIGRQREVTEIVALLRQPEIGLVTLTGPGGAGKTRLSLQVAADVLDDFTDGVWFVDLAPTSEPALAPAAIAQALGVTESAGQPLLESLKAYLRDKHLLLLLDNFEQITSAAPQIVALLKAAERLSVLVTSRVTLHLSGEHEVAVPPLALPDIHHLPALAHLSQYAAVDLFLQRCKAARADFQVTAATAPAVAEICVRLDGLPLALELAAARIKLFAPDALLQRLNNRLKLLTGGARDKEARQQTLRQTIDWSYNLLDPEEQRLFARLGVFVGGWSVEAAEAVCIAICDSEVEVLDGLQSLIDKSLLRHPDAAAGEPRFTMLETIREYASEQLEASGEAASIRWHHAAYYLALAEAVEPRLLGPEQTRWLDVLDVEHENLRAVLAWSRMSPQADAELAPRLVAALWRFWMLRGYRDEWDRWVGHLDLGMEESTARDALLAAQPRPAPLLQAHAKILFGRSVLALYEERGSRATALGTASLAVCQALGDPWGIAAALITLGVGDVNTGAFSRGFERLDNAVAAARSVADPWLVAWALCWNGACLAGMGPLASDTSVLLLAESLSIARQIGDGWLVAWILTAVGMAASIRESNAAAALHFHESLELWNALGIKTGKSFALWGLEHGAWQQQDYAAAQAFNRERLQLERELGNRPGVSHVLL